MGDVQEVARELIERCRQRDKAAFRKLVDQLMRPAYFQALSLLGSPDDAREVSQEAFFRLWQSMDKYDHTQAFYPWFYTILRNLSLNALRSKKRRPEEVGDWLELEAGAEEMQPERQHQMRQERSQVKQALSALCIEDREIICLKDLHDFTYKEIANLLAIPQGTAMSRLHAARQRFRQLMEEIGYEH